MDSCFICIITINKTMYLMWEKENKDFLGSEAVEKFRLIRKVINVGIRNNSLSSIGQEKGICAQRERSRIANRTQIFKGMGSGKNDC